MSKLKLSTLILLVVLIVLEVVFVHHKHGHDFNPLDYTSSHAWLGFLGGIILMSLSVFIGKHILFKDPDFYD